MNYYYFTAENYACWFYEKCPLGRAFLATYSVSCSSLEHLTGAEKVMGSIFIKSESFLVT